MSNLQGTNVAAMVVPFTTGDNFATHEDIYGKGGHRTVGTIAERNAISLERRKALMTVAVTANGKTYKLVTNPATNSTQDTDWELFGGGVTDYSLLENKPTSSVTSIDDAVTKKHTHTNILVLDKFTEVSGVIYFDGKPIASTSDDTFGGEFSTKADLDAYPTPQIGYSYIVTSDETQNGFRTYYQYIKGGKWQPMGTFSDIIMSGGGNAYNMQWNSPDVITANQEKILPVPYTSTFNAMGPTVLKFELGTQDVVKTLNEFDNGASNSFKYNDKFVEFVGGKMQLKTSFPLTITSVTTNPNCLYYTSKVSLLEYKNVESVVLSGGKFLFKLEDGTIYTFVQGTGWTVLGTGEPTDIMFIKNGVISISNTDFLALFTLAKVTDINILASKQNSATVNVPISTVVDLGNGTSYKSADIDLSLYADITAIRTEEI